MSTIPITTSGPPAGARNGAREGERRAMWRWTGVIVGLLLLQLALCAVGIAAALRGKGVAVEADYYNKALHWDDQAALIRASAELGWKTDLSVGSTATTTGQRALLLKLTDKAGAPLDNAAVAVTFFHHARPMELHQAELKATGGGLYASSVPLDRRGIWEFRLTIRRVVPTPSSANPADGRDLPTGVSAPLEQVFVATLQQDLLE
jgi:nitrogen fixation protein FixH